MEEGQQKTDKKEEKELSAFDKIEAIEDKNPSFILERDELEKRKKFDDLRTLYVLKGHKGPIRWLLIVDEKLFSASDDATIHIWDRRTGDSLGVLEGHDDSVCHLSAHKGKLYSSSWDRSARVWDIKHKHTDLILRGHKDTVVCTLANDEHIYTGSTDRTLRIWDPKTGNSLHTLSGHPMRVTTFALWNDKVLSLSLDKTIKVWNGKTGEHLEDIADIAYGGRYLELEGDNLHIGGDDGCYTVYNLKEKKILDVFDAGRLMSAFVRKPQGLYVVSYLIDRVQLWVPRTVPVPNEEPYELIKEFLGHTSGVTCMVEKDEIFFTGSADSTLRMWTRKTVQGIRPLRGHKSEVYTVKVRNNYAYTTSLDETARIWDIETGECLYILKGHEKQIFQTGLAYDRFYTASWDRTIRIWNALTGECLNILRGHAKPIYALAVFDGHIWTGDEEGVGIQWNALTGQMLNEFNSHEHGAFNNFDGSSDGNFLFATTDKGLMKLGTSGDKFGEIWAVYEAKVFTCLRYVNKDVLLVSCNDGHICVFNPEDLSIVRKVKVHSGYGQQMVVCKNLVYSVANDKELIVWDYTNGKKLFVLRGHEDFSYELAYDDDRIFTASGDGTVMMWDMQTILKPEFMKCFDKNMVVKNPKFFTETKDIADRNMLMALATHGFVSELYDIVEQIKDVDLLSNNKLGENVLFFALKHRQWSLLAGWEERPEIKGRGIYSSKNPALFKLLNLYSQYEDTEFFEHLWDTTNLKPQTDILSVCMLKHNPSLKLMELAVNKYSVLNAKSRKEKKTLLHWSSYYGCPKGAKFLLEYDNVKSNDADCDGNLPIHYCFTVDGLHENKVQDLAHQAGIRSKHMIVMERLETAKELLTVENSTKQPNLLARNKKGHKAYELALRQYNQCRETLKQPIRDMDELHEAEEAFEQASEVLDICNSYPVIRRHREKYAWGRFLSNAIPYFIWLLMLSVMFVAQSNTRFEPQPYFLHEYVSQTYAGNLDSVTDISSFWVFVNGTLLPTMNGANWNGPDLNSGAVGGGLRLIGSAMIRQIRVEVDEGCKIPGALKDDISACIPGAFEISKDSYGPNDQFKWSSNSDYGFQVTGPTQTRYPASGFIEYMTANLSDSQSRVNFLVNNNWLDYQTRYIVITFSLYDSGINTFEAITLEFEFLSSGKVLNQINSYPVKGFRYTEGFDWFILFLELAAIIYWFFEFPRKEFNEIYSDIKEREFSYYKDIWNYYEWLCIGMFSIIIILHLVALGKINSFDFSNESNYVDVHSVASIITVEKYVASIFLIMAWMRFLKLLKINPYTGPAAVSILETMQDNSFVVFVIICFFVVIAVALSFHVALGGNVSELRDIGNSLITLIRGSVFGDFDYSTINFNAIGVILFLFMKLFVSTLVMTVFIAVISDIYISLQKANLERWQLYVTSLMIDDIERAAKKPPFNLRLWIRSHLPSIYRKVQNVRGRSQTLTGSGNRPVEMHAVNASLPKPEGGEKQPEPEEEEVDDNDGEFDEPITFEDAELDDRVIQLREKRREEGLANQIEELKQLIMQLSKEKQE